VATWWRRRFVRPDREESADATLKGIPDQRILVTGQHRKSTRCTWSQKLPYDWPAGPLADVPVGKRLVLITAHRRESFGGPFEQICLAIRDLATRFLTDGVHFVYPVHLNPQCAAASGADTGDAANITLLEPLDYLSLVNLMKRSETDPH